MSCLYFEDLNCVFIHIPKNAGRNFHYVAQQSADQIGRIVKLDLPTHITYSELLASPAWHALERREPTVIGIVRNPWDRLVSRYLFRKASAAKRIKQRLTLRKAKKSTSLLSDLSAVVSMNLSGFSNWLITDRTPLYADGTWFSTRNQLDWVEVANQAKSPLMLRFEHFNEDIHLLPAPLSQLDWQFKHPKRGYSQYYTNKSRNFIADNFRKDIERFDYRFGE